MLISVDAVYALAHAVHNLIVEQCGTVLLCDKVKPTPKGPMLLQHIRNLDFIGKQNNFYYTKMFSIVKYIFIINHLKLINIIAWSHMFRNVKKNILSTCIAKI